MDSDCRWAWDFFRWRDEKVLELDSDKGGKTL